MDPGEQRRKRLIEQGYEETIFKKIEKKLQWWNEPAKNKYTIGAALRKMTFMEPSEYGFHSTRAGRLTERLVTLGLAAAIIASPTIVGVIPIAACLVGAKVAGMTVGALAAAVVTGLEGTMHKIDRYLNRPKEDPDALMDRVGIRRGLHQENLAGARNGLEQEVGTRNGVQMERPDDNLAGTRQFRDASLKQSFETAKLRTYDPNGPRPLENYGLGSKAQQQKMGG